MGLRLFVCFLAVLTSTVLSSLQSSTAQERVHTGRPLWKTFDTRHTLAANVTHQALLDECGFIYAANDAGLLNFDGVRWRLYEAGQAASVITAILPLPGEGWLAGGPGVIGKYAPDASGRLEWSPLQVELAASEDESTGTVSDMLPTPWGIIILTDRTGILYADDALTRLEIGVPTGFSMRLDDTYIVGIEGGLLELTVEGTRDLIAPTGWPDLDPVTVVYPSKETPVLVTRRSGLFEVSLNRSTVQLKPVRDVLPPPFDTLPVSAATLGPAGSVYFGFENGTFVQVAEIGEPIVILDKRAGFRADWMRSIVALQDDSLMVFYDGGASWVAPLHYIRLYDFLKHLAFS